MNKLSRCFLILLLLMSIVAAQGQSNTRLRKLEPRQRGQAVSHATVKLYNFRSPDDDFTIQFPSKPQREEDAQGLIGMIRRYSSTTDTYYFGITYQDVGPEGGNLKPSQEETVAALLEERGHKIVSARRLSRNITQMELWSPARTPGKFLHRIDRTIVSHDRMYTLGCGLRIADQEVDKAVCRRFFNSFRIIGVPQ